MMGNCPPDTEEDMLVRNTCNMQHVACQHASDPSYASISITHVGDVVYYWEKVPTGASHLEPPEVVLLGLLRPPPASPGQPLVTPHCANLEV